MHGRYSPSRAVDDGRHRDRDWRDRDRDRERDRERSPPRRYDDRGRYDDRDRVPPPRHYDDRDRPPPPRGYDEYDGRVPPPRHYDDGRVPPPRHYDDERAPPRRERDYGDHRGDYREQRYDRYEDRDRPRGHHERDDRERDRDRDRGQPSSPSSRDIIFLGLDPQLGETELAGFLRTEFHADLESTKIVREKSGMSKGFGFATFTTLQEAERFVYDNYPIVTMPALYGHSSAKRVKIDFAGSRSNNGGLGGTPSVPHPPPVRGHDGTRDIGQPDGTGRVLLLRGLDPGTYVGEVSRRISEEIARMVGKGVREAEGTITRVVMIVDRATEALWSFCFVELVTPELASALLPFLLSPEHQPNGFLIAQVPIAASFANPGAFIPTPAGPLGGQYLVRAAPDGGIGAATIDSPDGEWCAYWHQAAGAEQTVPRGSPGVPPKGTPFQMPDETKAFLGRLAGVHAPQPGPAGSFGAPAGAGPAAGPSTSVSDAQSSALPPTAMQPIKIGINLGAGVKRNAPPKMEDGIIPISHKNVLGDDEDDGDPGKDSVLLSRTKGAKIIPPTSTSRKIAKNINKWNTKQTELAKPPPPKEPKEKKRPVRGFSVNAIPLGGAAPAEPSTSPSAPSAPTPATASPGGDDFDYTDASTFATTGKGACLLCQRQFKTEEMLRKHVALSDLHKTNLADPIIRKAGQQRKEAVSGPKYRDRAAERREVHNQPDKPKLPDPYRKYKQNQPPGPGGNSTAASQPPPPPPAPTPAEANVGNKLLAKMGWTAGSGLGAGADGRVEPIKVQQFEERAGLGAAKGREAGRWSGPGGWHERKKDMTKERYEAADREH